MPTIMPTIKQNEETIPAIDLNLASTVCGAYIIESEDSQPEVKPNRVTSSIKARSLLIRTE